MDVGISGLKYFTFYVCNHEQKLAQGYQSMSLLNLKKNHGNLNTSLGFPQSLNINLKKIQL